MSRQPAPAVAKIIGAMVTQALYRCDRLGIDHAEFYRTLAKEQDAEPKLTLPQLFARVFRKLRARMN